MRTLERGMLTRPHDDLPRLVFADWLEENGLIDESIFLRDYPDVVWYGGSNGYGHGHGGGYGDGDGGDNGDGDGDDGGGGGGEGDEGGGDGEGDEGDGGGGYGEGNSPQTIK